MIILMIMIIIIVIIILVTIIAIIIIMCHLNILQVYMCNSSVVCAVLRLNNNSRWISSCNGCIPDVISQLFSCLVYNKLTIHIHSLQV